MPVQRLVVWSALCITSRSKGIQLQVADRGRGNAVTTKFQKWFCWSLVGAMALRTYFVQELVVAFVFFAIGFFILAVPVVAVFLLADVLDNAVVRREVSVRVEARHGNVV